jgi:hypothetical protein
MLNVRKKKESSNIDLRRKDELYRKYIRKGPRNNERKDRKKGKKI